MRRVEVESKSLSDYQGLIGYDAVSEIERLAEPLRGARVLHLNATAHGGGVAEMLPTLVALKRGLGIDAEWWALAGNEDFFDLTKKLHNGLQGMDVALSPDSRGLYLSTLDTNREAFESDWDFVVVHDPQPAGMLELLDGRRTGRWLWRLHVDTSTPNLAALDFLAPYMAGYEVAIFTLPEYAAPQLSPARTEYVYPSIDPLAPKNQALSPALARQLLTNRFGIDPDRPLMTQVSRYDPWKDPLGVIDAYRAVKERVRGVQLALVGNLADDDPEGIEYHARAVEYAGNDPDIRVLSTLDRLSQDDLTHALEVNAFQAGSDVVVQKSTREGFGLVVTEAMWKCAAVVGGRVGGIVHQIEDGTNGYLVSDVDECAERVIELLVNPDQRRAVGERARETVRKRFLTPRHLADYLRIFRSL